MFMCISVLLYACVYWAIFENLKRNGRTWESKAFREKCVYVFFLLEESMRDAASILCTCFGGDLICNCWETWWARSSNLEWNLIFLFFNKVIPRY